MMNNNKGFTLTEVLLAALIVGIIGVALAALTTAAVREGGVGRSRVMLSNQLSLFVRQLRQDVHVVKDVNVNILQSDTNHTHGKSMCLGPVTSSKIEPNSITSGSICYYFDGSKISRNVSSVGYSVSEPVLDRVKKVGYNSDGVCVESFCSPHFSLVGEGTDANGKKVSSLLRVRMIVEVGDKPKVNETIDEIFVLPQGISIQEAE